MSAFDEIYDQLGAFEKIVIVYSGSNDEGYIDDVRPEPAVEGVTISYELQQELEDAAYAVLERHSPGWEINEGSHGHLTVMVKDRQTFLHHGTIVEHTEWEDVVV